MRSDGRRQGERGGRQPRLHRRRFHGRVGRPPTSHASPPTHGMGPAPRVSS